MTNEQAKTLAKQHGPGVAVGAIALVVALTSGGSETASTDRPAPRYIQSPVEPVTATKPSPPTVDMRGVVGPLTGDLATDVVAQPRGRVVMAVDLPDGWAPISDLTLTKEATGRFAILATRLDGHTLKVMAENTSDKPARFTATFQYDRTAPP